MSSNLKSWPKRKKKKIYIYIHFILYNNEPFLDLQHMRKSGLYTITSNDQLCGWTEKIQSTSQSQTCIKKRSWPLFCGLLPVWSTAAFWIPVKPLHLRSMLSRLMRCSENCNDCSRHWSTERAQFFPKTMPDCTSHKQHFKKWMIWAIKFCLIHYIHLTSCQLTTTSSGISTTFCRENAPQPRGGRKCFPRVWRILIFMIQE